MCRNEHVSPGSLVSRAPDLQAGTGIHKDVPAGMCDVTTLSNEKTFLGF